MANEADEQADENWDIRFRQDEELDFFTELALHETERWIQSVTRKKFSYPDDFRRSLDNGVLLCELLNSIKPGSVKRINKLPGPIAGLDNINVFLKACKASFGLTDTHLFDVTDLEDLSQRAISDSEDILKQEQDRRSRNVAITIYWLGKVVQSTFSGPQLDFSAFGALVNHHGKDIISDNQFHHESWDTTDQTSAYSSHDSNSRGSLRDSLDNKHNRDSSYDSYGSYSNSRESELSFNLEEENMPGISMRRYNSTNSINRSGELQLPLNSEDDSLYQSTPDLADNNHARSPSTDSMDGSYHGNHSRQSSDSVDIPTRTLSTQRKTSTSNLDPMQFVKIKSSDTMAKKAVQQIKMSQEVKKVRTKIDREEEDWQSKDNDWQANLSSWRSRRRKQSAATLERVEGTDQIHKEQEDEEEKKPKTYHQMLEERSTRRKSTGRLNFYPVDDEEDSLFSAETVTPASVSTTESAPAPRTPVTKQRSLSIDYKDPDKAEWADSSDEEKDNKKVSSRLKQMESSSNLYNSHKHIGNDEDESNYNRGKVSEDLPKSDKTPLWKRHSMGNNVGYLANRINHSPEKSVKTSEDKSSSSSQSKISNILKSFEKKEEDAKELPKSRKPVIENNSSGKASRLQSSKWNSFESPSLSGSFSAPEKAESALSPRSTITEKTRPVPTKASVEKSIKISQKPNNNRGFGFTITGGADKRQPVVIQKVSLGGGADVNDVLVKDEILAINKRDIGILSHAQIQKLIDDAVRVGQIELRVKRAISEGDEDEEDDAFMDEAATSPTTKPDFLPSALTPRQSRGSSSPVQKQFPSPRTEPKDSYVSPSQRLNRVRSPVGDENASPTQRRRREITSRTESPTERSYKSPSAITEHRAPREYRKMRTLEPEVVPDEEPSNDFSNTQNDVAEDTSPYRDIEPRHEEITVPRAELQFSYQMARPVVEEIVPEVAVRKEKLPEVKMPEPEEVVEKPVVAVKRERKSPAIEFPASLALKARESPTRLDTPPPPPKEAPPTMSTASDDSNAGPPDILRRWQQKKPRPRSEYSALSSWDTDIKKDNRLSASFLWENKHSIGNDKQEEQVVEPMIVQQKKNDNQSAPPLKATVGQPVTLEIADIQPPTKAFEPRPVMITNTFQAGGLLQIDPRNQPSKSEENLPQYNFHVNISKPESKAIEPNEEIIQREREKIRLEEQRRMEEERRRWEEEEQRKLQEKEEKLRRQEREIREAQEQLRLEKERMNREREELERTKKLQNEVKKQEVPFHVQKISPTTFSTTSSRNDSKPTPSLRKLDVSKPMVESLATKDKARWSREDMLAMNRKATPLQKKPEVENNDEANNSNDVSREAPSRHDLHNLNAVPKPRFRGSMDWMKPEDREFHSNINNATSEPVLRKDASRASPNLHEHWLVEEAERRRKAGGTQNRQSATLPYNTGSGSSHIKPNNDVMNRWRDDLSVPKQQTTMNLTVNTSQPRTLNSTISHNRNFDNSQKHSYNPIPQSRVSLSQTLPHNFNSSLSPKREQPSVPPKPLRNSSSSSSSLASPTSPLNQAEHMAVSGKQCCSYCNQELGFGAAMVIESLGLYYHVQCFRCCVCHTALGNGSQGTDVRVRVNKLHCRNCYSNDEGGKKHGRKS